MITGFFVILGFIFMVGFVGAFVYEAWREYHD